MPLKGRVLATFVRGHQVFDGQPDGQGVFSGVCGTPLQRKWIQPVQQQQQVKKPAT